MSSPLTKTESDSVPQTNIRQVPKALDKNITSSGNLDLSSSSTGSIMEDEKRSNSNADSNDTTNGEPVDPRDLDWDGPDDPDNPHNWSSWKKWYATMTSAFLCLVVTMGSSLYVSSVPELVERYHVNQTWPLPD